MYLEYSKKMQPNIIYRFMENNKFIYEVEKKSDRGYKYLFSIKKYFIEFLKYFVKQEWAYKIEEENLELVNSEYILSSFSSRESDILYKIKTEEKEFYFVLLELQSSVDKLMAFRILEYMVEIWRRNIVNKQTKELPLIIPCVLYNGKQKWNKSKNFQDLFRDNKTYEKIIPQFEYILIDINDYEDETLLELSGIIGNVMYIEKGKTKEEIKERIKNLIEKMKLMTFEEQKNFFEWSAHYLAKDKKSMEVLKNQMNKKEEIGMLEDFIDEIIQDWIDEGMEKGMEKGIKEGRIKTLKKLLFNKFNYLPDEIQIKIDEMSNDELEILEKKIFAIQNVYEI